MDLQIQQLISQAIQYFQNGSLKEADGLLARILVVQPNNLPALEILGLIKASQGKFSESIVHLSKAVKLNPLNPATQFNYAKALSDNKDYVKAIVHYRKALQLDPSNIDGWYGRALSCSVLGLYEDVLVCYNKILSLKPEDAETWFCKGVALENLAQYQNALDCFDSAIRIEPNVAKYHNGRANILQAMKRYVEALAEYERAITLSPGDAGVFSNKGAVLERLGQYQSALDCFDIALQIQSNSPEIYVNKARVLLNLRFYDQAIATYKQALFVKSDHAEAHQGLAVSFLRDFNFELGWKEYEWRWFVKPLCDSKIDTRKSLWNGNKDKNKLLIWSEQGIGDQILYSSVFHELASLEKQVLVSIDKRLIPIYKRSFPHIVFLNKKNSISENLYDEHIPVGDLAKYFRANIDDFKKVTIPYLIDDQLKTNQFKEHLKSFQKVCCGIAWKSTNKDFGDDKSIPILDLLPLLNLEKYKFINLQHGDTADDLVELEKNGNHNLFQIPEIDLTEDLDSVISMVQACDLIITSSNSLAHMAGALNKRTILILPFESGKFWYWHEVNGYSPWYPSIRIFSQARHGSWGEVIDQVKQYLEGNDFE